MFPVLLSMENGILIWRTKDNSQNRLRVNKTTKIRSTKKGSLSATKDRSQYALYLLKHSHSGKKFCVWTSYSGKRNTPLNVSYTTGSKSWVLPSNWHSGLSRTVQPILCPQSRYSYTERQSDLQHPIWGLGFMKAITISLLWNMWGKIKRPIFIICSYIVEELYYSKMRK